MERDPDHRVPGEVRVLVLPAGPLDVNCYIVTDGSSGEAVVIDPGGEPDKIMAAAKEIGADIVKIWLTHGHMDHAGAAEEIKRRTGAPIDNEPSRAASSVKARPGCDALTTGGASRPRNSRVGRPSRDRSTPI